MSKAEWLLNQRPRRFKVSNPKSPYAVIIIMAGDGNLSDMAGLDIKEMIKGFSEDVSVLLLVDLPGVAGAMVAETTSSGLRTLDQLKKLSTGDPRALAAFLARALVSFSPKTRLAIGLWGHGQGVEGDNDPGEFLLPTALLRELVPPQRPRRRPGGVSAHGMLPDESSQDILTNREARSTLAVAFARAGRKEPVEMIFSDTCLNGAVEVFAELREFAHVVVASAFSVPGTGWQYKLFIERTASKKPATPREWGLLAVELYGEMYPSIQADVRRLRERQLAAFSTKPDFVRAFAKIVKALMAMAPKSANLLIGEAVNHAAKHPYGDSGTVLDIQQLVGQFHDLAGSDALQSACASYNPGGSEALKTACASFLEVFREAHVGISAQPYPDFPMSGLSIWVPIAVWNDYVGVGRYYRKLEFAKKTKWLKCLQQIFPELVHLRFMEKT